MKISKNALCLSSNPDLDSCVADSVQFIFLDENQFLLKKIECRQEVADEITVACKNTLLNTVSESVLHIYPTLLL